jgi:hypothetical protein
MAHNFKIVRHRADGNLRLKLAGDFDGNSALELLNVLKENSNDIVGVSIVTDNLKKIHPFGLQVFNQNYSKIKRHQSRIEFIGEHAGQITSI